MFGFEPACCSEKAQKWAFSSFNYVAVNAIGYVVSIMLARLARVDGVGCDVYNSDDIVNFLD